MAISGLTLGAATRRIEIGFVAPFLQQTRSVRYAYRMIGVDDAWTETTERLARFERLPAAALRFEVRAITSDGTTTPPASVEFMVASPIWRRWWFIAGVIATLAAVLLVLHRQRVASLLAVERMRTTIATDLHDDLGSSLSRMSILTEVARRQVADTPAAGILDDIGDSARSLIGALGDSIWAIDPRIDNLQSLVARTRHHASGMLEAAGINSRFQVQEGLQSVHLAPSDRRQLYLIIKEAVSNVVRHSSAKNVHVFISSAADGLHIDVIDDGHGFEPGASMVHESGTGGRGTASMRARAEALGGTMKVTSKRGEGTRLSVAVPLRHSAFPHLRSR
jgi:signal transduction histidine kinase